MVCVAIFMLFMLLKVKAVEIELLDCQPPDLPIWGGYGPQQEYYQPGDVIHYYCEVDTQIGGNFYRKCEDTGDWSGNTPVCDAPSTFSSTSQSSSLDEQSGPELAVDGIRTTCSSTIGGEKEEWFGNFTNRGQLIRVMIFLPKGPVSYEVVLTKPNGEEVVCGSRTAHNDRHDWFFHNCPEPHNTGASGVKIKSLSNEPLVICEIAAFVLTSPKCVDPRVRIESGRLRLNRKSATLVCNRGYARSPDAKLECIREGVWNRKNLYCIEREWEVDSGDATNREATGSDRRQNPERERERVGA